MEEKNTRPVQDVLRYSAGFNTMYLLLPVQKGLNFIIRDFKSEAEAKGEAEEIVKNIAKVFGKNYQYNISCDVTFTLVGENGK